VYTTETNEFYSVCTNTVCCRVSKKDFHVSFLDINELMLNEDAVAMHFEENAQFGGYYVFCSKKYQADEHFFGLGDKPMNLDLHGKRVQNWGTDAFSYERETDPLYKNIPFYI